MNPKSTLFWAAVAGALFAFIFFFERHWKPPAAGPGRILADFNASAATGVEVLPARQLLIHAERTNGAWRLTQPFHYPAEGTHIDALLVALEQLVPAQYLTAQELKNHPHADQEYGFEAGPASIVVEQGGYSARILIGARTAPGDQVYLQVVGNEGVYIVDADLLKYVPQSANDWRSTTFADLTRLAFDRLVVTNAGKVLDLRRNPTNGLWRMILPDETRADTERVEDSLRRLQDLHITQFVSDDTNADLDAYGLQNPDLSFNFRQGTNSLLTLQFGKSPTNNANQVYARRADQRTVVSVPREPLEPWRVSHEFRDFLDRHLLVLSGRPDLIEVHALDTFTLQRQAQGGWTVLPQGFPADPQLVGELISNLTGMQIVGVEKEVVVDQALPNYSLAAPAHPRQFILKAAPAAPGGTNSVIAQIDFGTNADKIYARRVGENFVYSVKPLDFERLPSASWQMRERKIWNFPADAVAHVIVQQNGRTHQVIHNGTNVWSATEPLAVEQTVQELGRLAAASWVARGAQSLDRFGLGTNDYRLSLVFKDGHTLRVEIGGEAPSGFHYAMTSLDNEPWIFEFPFPVYQLLQWCLPPP